MEVNRYEKLWIALSVSAILVMLVAITLAGFGLGVQLPGVAGEVDPRTFASQPPFDKPGVYEIAPGKYEVIMIAQIWQFNPTEVRVTAGSEVTFKVTSRDVTHGILIENTNVNLMILPGQVSEAKVTFKQPGEYLFVCHEYCGTGHQAMAGKVIVTP